MTNLDHLHEILKGPLMPWETIEDRIRAVKDATPGFGEAERLHAVLSSITQSVDLSSQAKPNGAPGILEEFACKHPWMWKLVNGQWKCKAHSWLYAAVAEARLLQEIEKRLAQNPRRLNVVAKQILSTEYFGKIPNDPLRRGGEFRNPWFIPQSRRSSELKKASEKIATFYRNRKRKTKRLAGAEERVGLPLTTLCHQLGTGRQAPLKKSLSKSR